MTQEEMINEAIKNVAELLRTNPFKMEFKVVKKPKGIRIIYEVTQEEMDTIIKMQKERGNKDGNQR